MYCLIKGCKEIGKHELGVESSKAVVCDKHREAVKKIFREYFDEIVKLKREAEDKIFSLRGE